MFRIQAALSLTIASVLLHPSILKGASPEEAALEIRQLLRSKKVDRLLFPNGPFDPTNFDPRKFDPLMIEATWEHVRQPICEIVKRRVGVQIWDDSLKLYVGTVPEASSPRSNGGVSRSQQLQIVFVEYDPRVRDVLMRALALPKTCFSTWKQVAETRTREVDTKTAPWDDIGAITSSFVSTSRRVQQLGFAVQAPVYLADRVQVVTSWRRYGRYGGYDMFWRLFFQVRKSEQLHKITVTVRGQVARCLPGASTQSIEYLGSEEFDSRLDVEVGGDRAYVVRKFVPDGAVPGVRPQEPLEVSTSAQLAHELLDAYIGRLTM